MQDLATILTETTIQASPKDKLKTIAQWYSVLKKMLSKPLPEISTVVIIGNEYKKETLQLDTVAKIDKRGVITTGSGIRFSTIYTEISSTKNVGDRYWSMFDLEVSYQRALKRQEELRVSGLRSRHQSLMHKVERLQAVKDAGTIDLLLEILEQES